MGGSLEGKGLILVGRWSRWMRTYGHGWLAGVFHLDLFAEAASCRHVRRVIVRLRLRLRLDLSGDVSAGLEEE
jgi:hypothetical protein